MSSEQTPAWLNRLIVEAIHFDQIREHGGLHGVRDEDVLESSILRPLHKWSYEKGSDPADLAATYGYGIAKNHPFCDGNKRTAFLAMITFLGLNNIKFEADQTEVVTTMLLVASGHFSETQLADWLREHLVPSNHS